MSDTVCSAESAVSFASILGLYIHIRSGAHGDDGDGDDGDGDGDDGDGDGTEST
jgi:hypothetical protein